MVEVEVVIERSVVDVIKIIGRNVVGTVLKVVGKVKLGGVKNFRGVVVSNLVDDVGKASDKVTVGVSRGDEANGRKRRLNRNT